MSSTLTPRPLPRFDHNELVVGPVLGMGEFGIVCEILQFNLKKHKEDTFEEDTISSEKNGANGVNDDSNDRNEDILGISEGPKSIENMANHHGEDDGDISAGGSVGLLAGDFADEDSDYYRNGNTYNGDGIVETEFDEEAERLFMRDNCQRNSTTSRYAVKKLRGSQMIYVPEDYSDVNELGEEVDVLGIEAKFLAIVMHPNIVKVRGISAFDLYDQEFFIIMDRLYGTLDERIDEWYDKSERLKAQPFWQKFSQKQKIKKNAIWIDRLYTAVDLVSAMKFLHSHGIAYRDLKPENIGFDVRGDLKLFDFGLSRFLPRTFIAGDKNFPLYDMTGITGSRRYMAPEVVMSLPYNLTSDVFSFGILMWEMTSMKLPFQNMGIDDHLEKVVKKQQRPKISSKWPKSISNLMEACWSTNIKKRPDMEKVSNIIKEEIKRFEGGSGEVYDRSRHMLDKSNRSQRARAQDRMNFSGRGAPNH